MRNRSLFTIIILSLVLTLSACSGDDASESESEVSEESSQLEESKEETEEKTEASEDTSESSEDSEEEEAQVISGRVEQNFDLSDQDSQDTARLWIPYAQSDEYQDISNEEIIIDEESGTASLEEDDLGNKMIYVEFEPDAEEKKISYSFDVTRKEALRPEIKEEEDFNKEDFSQYLEDSEMLNINGPVKDLAAEITEGEDSVEDKVKAIYDWIYDNMVRDNAVLGCGTGDVDELLQTKAGKCTDIGSVFVALCRASGIPAKETFGVRISEDETADITTSQHCWVSYYQPGTGWFPIDIADVLKYCLNDNLDKDSPEAMELKDYFYGNWDAKRVGFTTGRDLNLVPQQEEGPLNQFGYPYAEIDGEALDFYDPETFSYNFTWERSE